MLIRCSLSEVAKSSSRFDLPRCRRGQERLWRIRRLCKIAHHRDMTSHCWFCSVKANDQEWNTKHGKPSNLGVFRNSPQKKDYAGHSARIFLRSQRWKYQKSPSGPLITTLDWWPGHHPAGIFRVSRACPFLLKELLRAVQHIQFSADPSTLVSCFGPTLVAPIPILIILVAKRHWCLLFKHPNCSSARCCDVSWWVK